MYLYLLTKEEDIPNTFDSCIVAAETEEDAKHIHPDGDWPRRDWWEDKDTLSFWTHPNNVITKWIGIPNIDILRGVVLSSYNAG